MTGISFELRPGIPWEYLPQEMNCGSGMTYWRRLRDWQQAGVWDKIWRALLDDLGVVDEIDWSAAVIDSCSTRALFGGAKTGPNPTDRGKNGSKRDLITDGYGTPSAIEHTGANVHIYEMAIPVIDAVKPIRRSRGRPRKRPESVLPDRAYDAEDKIRELRRVAAIRRREPLQLTYRYAHTVHDRAEVVYVHQKEISARLLLGPMKNPQTLESAGFHVMEPDGIEPTTSCMPCKRSPN